MAARLEAKGDEDSLCNGSRISVLLDEKALERDGGDTQHCEYIDASELLN